MTVHLVNYDLFRPGQKYDPLIKELSRIGRRILLSTWIVEVNQSAAVLRNVLLSYLDANDALLVVEIKPGSGNYDWAYYLDHGNAGAALLKKLRP